MDRRRKSLLIILTAFIVLVILVYFLVQSLGPKDLIVEPYINQDIDDAPVNTSEVIVAQVEQGTVGSDVVSSGDTSLNSELTRVAAMFTERFGTYSNQGDFDNAEDLKVFMSDELYSWATGYFASLKKELASNTEYYGMNTRSIAVKTNSLDTEKGIGDFSITAQRTEKSASAESTVKYQTFAMKMIFNGETWKIDFVKWE